MLFDTLTSRPNLAVNRTRRFHGLIFRDCQHGAPVFVNFFQPSFKLASKQRDGAKVTKRYHPPQTPCERLLQADSITMAAKSKLREISANLDPLKLLEEMRAVQAYLTALADGGATRPLSSDPPNLAAFVASLSSAWHLGRSPSTPSLAKPGSRRFAWYGQSFAGALKAFPTSTRRSSSTNCASSFLAGSPRGNTRPSCGA